MLILLIAIITALCYAWIARNGSDDLLAFIGAFFGSFLLVILCLVAVVNRAGVGSELAGIEQQRHAASTLHGINASQVYGDCVTTNATIASNKWYRKQWWSSTFVAPAWDTVSTIVLLDTTRR